MTDDLRPDDEIDLAASAALDASLEGRGSGELPAVVRRRVEQFDSARAALRDDRDAPTAERIDQLVATAMAAATTSAGDPAPVPVSSLAAHRARRLRRVLAAAAGVVVLVGAGWFLARGSDPDESAGDATTGAEADARAEAGPATELDRATPPAAPTTTAAPATDTDTAAASAPKDAGTEGAGQDQLPASSAAGEAGGGVVGWSLLLNWTAGGDG